MTADTLAFIFSCISLGIAIPSMLIARYYYLKTKRIKESFQSREERPRYGQK